MTATSISSLFTHLSFTATRDQARALYELEEFLDPSCTDDAFVLCGAAGTGKTSLVKALVDYLCTQQTRFFLNAPTGRAAKVLSQKTGVAAHTVHHLLYTPQSLDNGRVLLTRRPVSPEPYSIYVVDEASMLSGNLDRDGQFVATRSLLEDLLDHVKTGNARSKVIFIGDRYQLAPINEGFSPALSVEHLQTKFGLTVRTAELTEVMRQTGNSPVLTIATDYRRRSDEGRSLLQFDGVYTLSGGISAALSRYVNLYRAGEPDNVVMIGFTNKSVNFFNQFVRERLGLTGVLAVGDLVVVNENWTDGQRLLTKGDTGRVVALDTTLQKREGFTFQSATLAFTDADGQAVEITTLVMHDALLSERGEVNFETMRNLIADRMRYNQAYRDSGRAHADPYLGAMRLRYGHALTGHKAQGGEWTHVLLDPYFRPNEYRYAYTAVTRARETVMTWGRRF